MPNTYTGQYVADYIVSITPDPKDVVWHWLEKYIIPNTWTLETIDIFSLTKDPSFEEALAAELPGMSEDEYYYRYEPNEDYDDIYKLPIVFFESPDETILIDGYSRTMEHIFRGHEMIDAFIISNK